MADRERANSKLHPPSSILYTFLQQQIMQAYWVIIIKMIILSLVRIFILAFSFERD